MFFSTHLLVDVELLCNRLAILSKGKVGFLGTPGEYCRQYKAANLEQAYLACTSKKEH